MLAVKVGVALADLGCLCDHVQCRRLCRLRGLGPSDCDKLVIAHIIVCFKDATAEPVTRLDLGLGSGLVIVLLESLHD